MHGLESLLGDALGADAVAALDLVGVLDLLAREPAGDGLGADELRPKPGAPALVEAVQALEQRGCVAREVGGVAQLLGLDPLFDLGRPVVGVDKPVDVAAEPQAELEVASGNVAHARSNRAACPWPTPTQSVASP